MTDLFLNAFNAVSTQDFEEVPVDIEEFVQSEDFLGLPPLSDLQYLIIRAGSQIYKYETLEALYGEKKAHQRWKETNNEVILQAGKGSGKDYTSTIVCAYVVYLLLCLKNPAQYYGKPQDDTIDIVNIATNSDQAKNVFFKNFMTRIKNCQWFENKYVPRGNNIEFDKNINVYSGHSEREAFEGLNLILAVLDEIAAFALESNTGNEQANTASATYHTYRDSVDSRFSEFGKVLLLSFPRFKGDYIQQSYEDAIAEKEVVVRTHTFKIDKNLPDGTPGNEFDIQWDEDHIIRYKDPHVFALKRPSWEVNPIVELDSPAMIRSFRNDPGNALGKYACMPSNLEDGIFKNKDAIERTFTRINGVDESGVFHPRFEPKDDDTRYYIHVDLAQKHDHCAVALSHVDKWVKISVGSEFIQDIHPVVVVDAVRWWTPTADKSVDFQDVVDYIKSLRRRGFNIKLATFDRWNSHDTMKDLERNGIKTDILSVAKKHYDDFLAIMYDERLVGPNIELLKDELGQLKIIKNKVEHPRKGSKDLSDATCGAIFNAVAYTPKHVDEVVEALTLESIKNKVVEEDAKRREEEAERNVIRAPRSQMPPEIEAYLEGLRLL